MSQAIKLPTQIVTAIVDMGNRERLDRMEIAKTVSAEIKDYAHEVAIVAIILSDNYMKDLYEQQGSGYIAAIDTLHDWAAKFVELYAYVEEWEEFCNTQTVYENIMSWDDFVIAFGADMMRKNRFNFKEQ